MKQFLMCQRDWLQIEWLPSYAPDLNPTEGVWINVKGKEMANLCPDRIDEATVAFRRGLRRSHEPWTMMKNNCEESIRCGGNMLPQPMPTLGLTKLK